MPVFQYQALDANGRSRKGVAEGATPVEVRRKLRGQGLMVTSLEPHTARYSRGALAGEHLVTFTVQLSQLVGAGLPLYESLVTMEEQCRGERFHPIILSLTEKIQTGSSLSEAMRSHPDSFDTRYCSMVSAGEASGALGKMLERLSELLEGQLKMKRQVGTALLYPAVLSVFCLLVIAMLLGFVVPSIEGIFEGRELNGFTQFVMSTSHLFQSYWWLILGVIAAFIAVVTYQLRTPKGQRWMESMAVRIPLVKKLTIQSATARLSRTMATLLEGGVTLIDALRLARGVMKNHVLEGMIAKAEEGIIEGSSLSSELKEQPIFPALVPRMVAVGEETGNMVLMWEKIAEIYEGEVEKTVGRIMALAQPVVLVIMGLIIGSILMAVLLPLTDISSLGT